MTTTTEARPTTRSTPRRSSGPKLSEAARHLVIPEGIVTSVFPRVERRLARARLVFDPWQQGFGMAALGCRESGLYASTIGGVCASIPRQVGKTRTVGQLVLGLCLEFPGLRVVWTSHHGRTNTATFKTLQGLVKRKGIREYLAPIGPKHDGIRSANGEQEIEFANGSIIMFGARAQGFGRGFEEIDVLVLDEAQILDGKALDDMVPSTNQGKHKHGALIFFTGTPPRPTDPGEAFTFKRTAALAGHASDHMWVEFSADPDAAADDETQWPIMNPSYPHRTPRASMLRMRENLPDEDSWRREAMGIWPTTAQAWWEVVTEPQWAACKSKETKEQPGWLEGPVALAVEMTSDQTSVSIVAAGTCREGGVGVEVVRQFAGTAGVVDELVALTSDQEHPVSHVALDPASPAGLLFIDKLTEAGITVTECKFADMKQATADFHDGVVNRGIVHRDRPELNASVAGSVWRLSGDARLIDRRTPVDAGPLNGCVIACWALRQPVGKPKPRVFNLADYLTED